MSAFFDSECSSGCESGWTLYLDHSNLLNHNNNNNASHDGSTGTGGFYDHEDQEQQKHKLRASNSEEDLSMLSDASSGPPHLPHDDIDHHHAYFNKPEKLAKSGSKKHKKVRENKHHEDQHLPSFLHDTASSPVLDFSTNNIAGTNQQQTYTGSMLDYSQGQGFSSTYFEGRPSSFQEEHLGFLQPSQSGNKLQGNNRWYGGKGMGMG